MRERLLRSYARWVIRRKPWIVLGACLLTAASLAISILFLKTQTGITDLYSKNTPVNRLFLTYIDKFGAAENLMIIFEGSEPKRVHQAMDALGERLRHDPHHYIESLFYRVNLDLFKNHALQFLSEAQAQAMLDQVRKPQGGIREIFSTNNLNDFFAFMNQSLEAGMQKSITYKPDQIEEFNKLIQPLLLLRDFLNGEDLSKTAITTRLDTTAAERSTLDAEGYLQTDDQKMHVMFVRPVDRRQDYKIAQQLVKWSRAEIEQIRKDFPDITIGLTGGPALNNDQFEISKKDMTLASIFAYFSTGIIFILAFRSFGRPLLGLLTLSLSLTCVFGLTTLTIGHLNIFSMSFIVILVGQGTYYGVHVVARYEEELLHGRAPNAAMEETLTHVFGNITTSTLTTAAAFFATTLVPLKGFAELGWIAGMGVIVSSIGMQMLLPALLLIYDRKGARGILDKKKIPILNVRMKEKWVTLATAMFNRHSWLIIIAVVGTALWGAYRFYSPQYGITFDSNLLNLQAKNTEAVRYEKKLIETSLSPRAAVFMTASLDEARRFALQAQSQPSVQRVEWLGSVFPEGNVSNPTHEELRRGILSLPVANLTAPDPTTLKTELSKLRDQLEKIQNMALNSPQGEKILPTAEAGISALEEILTKLPSSGIEAANPKALDTAILLPRLEEFQNRFFGAIRGMLLASARAQPLTLQDMPKEMISPFISPDKTYAVYAFPSVNIWESAPLEQFINEMRKVSPNVTGPPVMFFEILNIVRDSYFKTAGYSALAIFLLFLLDFRSLRYAIMASFPLVLGVFCLFGLMSLLKIPFNTANMIALPMVLGIGADNGVHLIHRFLEEKKKDISFLFRSTGKALIITYLDTLTSFLGLALANHQGMAHLGQVVLLGITCCTICGVLFLPAVMNILIQSRAIPSKIKKPA